MNGLEIVQMGLANFEKCHQRERGDIQNLEANP